MYAVEIVERGPSEQVWNEPVHDYTTTLIEAIPVIGPKIKRWKTAAAMPATRRERNSHAG